MELLRQDNQGTRRVPLRQDRLGDVAALPRPLRWEKERSANADGRTPYGSDDKPEGKDPEP